MIIDYNSMEEKAVEGFLGGKGTIYVKMVLDEMGKKLTLRMPKGTTIGLHTHSDNCEVEFFIKGKAKVTCDGTEEILEPGMCHYCPKGSSHVMESIGDEDLVLYAVVPVMP